MSKVRIHPTALIEPGVHLGPGTSVWDNVHIRHGASLGHDCIVGEKTYIAYDVRIGNCVKINAAVYICALVEIEDFVMISAGTIFTNDKYPRAFNPDLAGLASSDPNDETLATTVGCGATIGANATIGPGLRIGRFAMVGMGSVVTASVPDHALVLGNPARLHGWVCTCGPLLCRKDGLRSGSTVACAHCGRVYRFVDDNVQELSAAALSHP